MEIYVQKDGQQMGPFAEAKIRQSIDAGEFTPDDLAWTNGKVSWQPLSSLLALDMNTPPPVSPPVSDLHPVSPNVPTSVPAVEDTAPPTNRLPGAKRSVLSILSYDLSANRFGFLWRWAGDLGRIIGFVAIPIAAIWYLHLFLSDHFGDHRTEWQKERDRYMEAVGKHSPAKALSLGTPMFEDLDKQLADRAREVAKQSPATVKQVGLRATKEEFTSCYGDPFTSSVKSATESVMAFHHDDYSFIVRFWNGRSHEIDVFQKAGQRLTQQQAQKALTLFGGDDKWTEISRADARRVVAWKQEGAAAMLTEANMELFEGMGTTPVDTLKIITEEYLREVTK